MTISWINKVPYKVILIWIGFVSLGYYLTVPSNLSFSMIEKTGSQYYPYVKHVQSAFVTAKIKDYMPQAIVFISMGNMSKESLVEDSVSAVRALGHWTDLIYIITDRPKCFDVFTLKDSNTKTVLIPSKSSIIEIKKIKAEVFQYLPPKIHRILYMDVDILITRNLGLYLQDLSNLLYLRHHAILHKDKLRKSRLRTERNEFQNDSSYSQVNGNFTSFPMETDKHFIDFAAFLDAKGHYVGFCAGCEKWHTGVLYLMRGQSDQCMKGWASILSSGMFNTDQESLDFAEKNGSCPQALSMPSRHLLFAKDYIAMLFTSGQTFIHLTSANRADNNDYFYRDLVVPRIRNSLHPPLRSYQVNYKKEC